MYIFVQNEFKWEPVTIKCRNIKSNDTQMHHYHQIRRTQSARSPVKPDFGGLSSTYLMQNLSFVWVFSHMFDMYGLWMLQEGRTITWGQGSGDIIHPWPSSLCDNNNRIPLYSAVYYFRHELDNISDRQCAQWHSKVSGGNQISGSMGQNSRCIREYLELNLIQVYFWKCPRFWCTDIILSILRTLNFPFPSRTHVTSK